MLFHDALNIYTDGSSYSNPRKGGMGAVFVFISDNGIDEVVIERQLTGHQGATNNQMELKAVILALREIASIDVSFRVTRIVVFTDSRYVTDNYPRAIGWSRNKWLTQSGAPVTNALLWKELLKLCSRVRYPISFKWVKGHAKSDFNKKADKIAKLSAKALLAPPLQYTDLRRKTSDKKTVQGSVPMQGQVIDIRIVTCEYQKLHHLFKYRYEVLTTELPYTGFIDLAFFKDALRTGHSFKVRFNDELKNPRIVEVLEELIKTKSSELNESIQNSINEVE